MTAGTTGGSEAILSIVNTTSNDSISIDLGKTTSELMVGDAFDLSTEAQNFIASAGGLSGVRWGLIAGDTSDFNTNVFLTSSSIDLTAKAVANATKGAWGNSIIQLIGNLNSGDATGIEVNNTYGPFADSISSPNYASGGHFDWQSGDNDLNNLADGTATQNLYTFTFTGFVGTANGVQVLDTAELTATQLIIGSSGGGLPDPADPSTKVVALPDIIGATTPEYVVYTGDITNRFDIKDGNTGAQLRSISFFSAAWEPVAAGSLPDGNNDGMPNDGAIAVLARNINTGQLKVQLRDGSSGAVIGSNVAFFNSDWIPLGLTILKDSDGNGVEDDPAAVVLAKNTVDGRNAAEAALFSNGNKLGRWNFFRPYWEVKAVTAFTPVGGVPRISVLGTDTNTGKSKVQSRLITNSAKSAVFFFGPGVESFDLGVLQDTDGNGTADDPSFVVLGKKNGGNNIVRIRRVSDGSKVDDWLMIGGSFDASGLAVLPDVNLTGFEDVAAIATPSGGGNTVIKVRDLEDGSNIDTVTLSN